MHTNRITSPYSAAHGHSIPIPRYQTNRRRGLYISSCGYCFTRISCRRNSCKMPASILRYLTSDFRRVYMHTVHLTYKRKTRRKSAIECKYGYMYSINPEQYAGNRRSRSTNAVTVRRSADPDRQQIPDTTLSDRQRRRHSAGSRYRAIYPDRYRRSDRPQRRQTDRRNNRPPRYSARQIPPEQPPRPDRPRPRPASTAGTDRRSPTAPAGFSTLGMGQAMTGTHGAASTARKILFLRVLRFQN